MKATTRNILTAVSAGYLLAVGLLFRHISLDTFNLLLACAVVPMVWLIWAFARFSAYQHARRWERDIAEVHRTWTQPAERVRR